MKNKALIVLSVCAIVFMGCKKNYNCVCDYTTTTTDPTSSVSTKGATETSYNKVSKKFANESCSSGKDISTTGTGTNAVTVNYTRSCSLS